MREGATSNLLPDADVVKDKHAYPYQIQSFMKDKKAVIMPLMRKLLLRNQKATKKIN